MTFARSLRQIAIVVRKEIKDSLRDRRALWSIVFSVSIGPMIIGFMMNRVADRQRESEHVRVPVVGMQYAPALVEWLRQQSGVEIVQGPANPEEAVRKQEEELTITGEVLGTDVRAPLCCENWARRWMSLPERVDYT